MALRYLVGRRMRQHVIPANSSSSSYPRARGLCLLSSNPNQKSGSKPTYLPPFRRFFYFIDENFVSELLDHLKRRRRSLSFGCSGYSRLNKDDPSIRQLANHVLKHYNKQQNVKLEFVSVLSACRGDFPLERHLVVQACDPLAARVPLKLQAVCVKTKHNRDMVQHILPPVPEPFMRTIDETNDEDNKRNKSKAYVETLLFANIRSCPIIDKRLGLNGLLFRDHHGYIVKVSLKDDVLLTHAMFALKKQNENQKKGSRLRFLRVVGAWLERVGKERVVYHIMLKALEGKVRRRFFAAVASKPVSEDVQLLDWVLADSPRATMS